MLTMEVSNLTGLLLSSKVTTKIQMMTVRKQKNYSEISLKLDLGASVYVPVYVESGD